MAEAGLMPRNVELSPRMLLSEREAEVLELMAQGASRAETIVATRLDSVSVKQGAYRMYGKLDVTSSLQAALWYHDKPILFPRRSGAIKIHGEPEAMPNPNSILSRDLLSPRAFDVLDLLAKGAESHDIAQVLHLSVSGVKNYMRQILDRLEVANRTQAALWFHDKPILFSRHRERYVDPEAK